MKSEGLTLYISAFIDELVRSGLRHIVVSPGSRSTPLAVLAAEHGGMKVWMNIDERSAAFFALGLAKAKDESVALLCTSGTAAANYMPAIAEANLSRVPLVVLTADRPHELRDVGAPQTIDQIGLYGDHVKWFMEMPIPEAELAMIRHARIAAARAVAASQSKPSGPVHLNFPLREPLLPNLEHPQLFISERREQQAYTNVQQGVAHLGQQSIASLANELSKLEKGLIICGPHDEPEFAEAVMQLAVQLRFPVLADPLSQLRSGSHDHSYLIEGYDSFLRDDQAMERMKPEIIIRFGAMPVSKPLLLYMNRHHCRHIVVDEGGWRDATLLVSDMITAKPALLCKQLTEQLETLTGALKSGEWANLWCRMNRATMTLLQEVAVQEDSGELFEGRVVTELQELMPPDTLLFVGNSMPIRDVDTFFSYNDRNIRIMANRGANGIDGLVSTAIGASAAGKRTVLLLGDLSFYHDMNGLLAAKLHHLPITIIIVNNDGGGIFSFLPQSALPRHYEELFGTPIGLDYSHAVKMYGGAFTRIDGWPAFRQAFEQAMSSEGLQVIEVPTDRASNVMLHRQIWPKLSAQLAPLLAKGE